jgi:hypothetical protein
MDGPITDEEEQSGRYTAIWRNGLSLTCHRGTGVLTRNWKPITEVHLNRANTAVNGRQRLPTAANGSQQWAEYAVKSCKLA